MDTSVARTHYRLSADSPHWHKAAARHATALPVPGSSFSSSHTWDRCACSSVRKSTEFSCGPPMSSRLEAVRRVRGSSPFLWIPVHPCGSKLVCLFPTAHPSAPPEHPPCCPEAPAYVVKTVDRDPFNQLLHGSNP